MWKDVFLKVVYFFFHFFNFISVRGNELIFSFCIKKGGRHLWASQQIKPTADMGCGKPIPRCCSAKNTTCSQLLTKVGN